MRINIDIDDQLINRVLELTGLPTKEAVVGAGLELLIRMQEQASVRELFDTTPIDNDLKTSRRGRRF